MSTGGLLSDFFSPVYFETALKKPPPSRNALHSLQQAHRLATLIYTPMKTANQSTRTVTSRMLRATRAVQSKGKRRRISDERQSPVPGIHRICKLSNHSLGYELLPCLRNRVEISRLHVFLRRAGLGNPTSDLRQVPSHYTHRPPTSSITNHYSDRKTDYFFLAGFLLILAV